MSLRWVKNAQKGKELINLFRIKISWEKYQECLKIEREYNELIRSYGERKKWRKLTPLEFFEEKRKFFWDSVDWDNIDEIYESLRNKPYLSPAEIERLIGYSECSSRHTAVFYIKLENFCLEWITDDEAKMLSESGATGIVLNEKILTPTQKKILKWRLC